MAAAKATKTLARAERLIATGADVNAKDHVGGTPLGRAVNQGREAMVKLLIDSGADVNIKDDSGWTPLHIAVRRYPNLTGRITLLSLKRSSLPAPVLMQRTTSILPR